MQSIQMEPGENELASAILEETDGLNLWVFVSSIIFILLAAFMPIYFFKTGYHGYGDLINAIQIVTAASIVIGFVVGFLNGFIATFRKKTFTVTNYRFLILSYWWLWRHGTREKQQLTSYNWSEIKSLKAIEGPFSMAYLRFESSQNSFDTLVFKGAIDLYDAVPESVKKLPIVIKKLDVLKIYIGQKIFPEDSICLSGKVWSNPHSIPLDLSQKLQLIKGKTIYGEDGTIYSRASGPKARKITQGISLLFILLFLLSFLRLGR